jgi:UDP-glucose 4-epimerase
MEKPVLVTGGASFIGSHLVDFLSRKGASVSVIDNLSSGLLENLKGSPNVNFIKADLETDNLYELKKNFEGIEVVFHLAAAHGGRGYIDTHPADVCSNFATDNRVFKLSFLEDIETVVQASSACVYPPSLQNSYNSDYLLIESDANISDLTKPLSADLEYGWAKIMSEIQLQAYYKQYGMKSASMRFVTAYGPRENETHAIIALIYKALAKMDPYEIWGSGNQDRDFTYVEDIVSGCLLAAEKNISCERFNLGTGKRYTLKDTAETIFNLINWHPKKIYYDESKPTGVISRALDISYTENKLGWKPIYNFKEGLRKTIMWYIKTHPTVNSVDHNLLLERISEKIA